MKKGSLIVGIVAMLIAIGPVSAVTQADDKPNNDAKPCGYCGMDTTLSPTHITAVYTVKGKKPVVKNFLSIGCYMRVAMIDPPEGSFSEVKILGTSTFGSKEPKYIPIESAWYVSVKSLSSSMPPYLASFALKKTAVKYAKAHDSRVLNYEAARSLVIKEISG